MPLKKIAKFKRVPFITLLLPLVLGILFANNFIIDIALCYSIELVLLFLYGAFYFCPKPLQVSLRPTHNLLIVLLFFILGCLLFTAKKRQYQNSFGEKVAKIEAYTVTLTSPLIEKTKTWKATALLKNVYINNKWIAAKGKALLYFKDEAAKPKFGIGATILINARIAPIANSGNPGSFDYKQYCARQGIYFQSFVSADNVLQLSYDSSYRLSKLLNACRNWVITKIDANIRTPEARSVAKALLIGYRNDLDKDMLQDYANAGVIHIISISGLHLMIISGLFIFLFAPLKKIRYGRQIQVALVLLVTWFFTLMAGAVPSVSRAAIMITVYLLATILNRKPDVYNALAVSAFILLVYNPYFLWDLGFILSYSAVLSIVLFYPLILSVFTIKNKLLRGIWQLAAVSISAQIITLPIVLYYFHQFPNLFIFANIVAVFLSTIILYAEILLLLFSPFSILCHWVGAITEKLILYLDAFISFVAQIPFAVTHNVSFSLLQVFLLIITVIAVYFFIKLSNKLYFFAGLVCFLACIIVGQINAAKRQNQAKIIVYNVPHHLIIDFVNGHHFYSISDDTLMQSSTTYRYVLKPSRSYLNVSYRNNLTNLTSQYPIYLFKNKRIFLLNKHTLPKLYQAMKLDIIILSDDVVVDWTYLKQHFPNVLLVFSNKNSFWKIEKWKKQCLGLHLHFHSVLEGAFVMDLRR